MRKLFFTLALILCASSVMGQETAKPKKSIAGFETNAFWDNWELSISGGVGTAFVGKNNPGSKMDRIGWMAGVSAQKWIHPVFGARLAFQAGKYSNYLREGGTQIKWPFINVHADFMINFSNWVGGYREDRVYYAVPTVGFGYLASGFTDSYKEKYGLGTGQSFAFNASLINKFRVCPCLDIDVEIAGVIARQGSVTVDRGGSYAGLLNVTAGLTYRFNQRTFKTASPYSEEDVMAYQSAIAAQQEQINAAAAENDRLNQELADARAAADRARVEAEAAREQADKVARARRCTRPAEEMPDDESATEEIYMTTRGVAFFNYSSSQLSDKEKLRLDIIAEQIINTPDDKVYLIEGHADAQTGSKAGNRRVAENRAKRVYDYLVSKGVNPDRLSYKGYADSKSPFSKPEFNRVTVIR